VGVLLGNGDGTFQPAQAYGSGGNTTTSLAVADVNGDGKLDLLVANKCVSSDNCANGNVGVLWGNGDGTFQSAQTYSSGGMVANAVAAQDVNGDGKPDLLVANYCGTPNNCHGILGVLLGNDDGTFQTAQTYDSGGSEAVSLAVADLNRDGKPDVIIGHFDGHFRNRTRSAVSVLLGNGDGTFGAAQAYNSLGHQISSIAVADVNGDGNLDLLLATLEQRAGDRGPGVVSVMLGHGDGTFGTAQVKHTGNSRATAIAVTDANRDGKLDVVVLHSLWLAAWFGNGDGTFQFPTKSLASGFTKTIAVADLNGDGRLDVTVAGTCFPNDCSSGAVGVFFNAVPFVTSTGLASSLNPSVYGQAVTLTATVSSDGASMPTGTIAFKNGSKVLGKATLSGGVAVLTVSNMPAGTLSLTAAYNGDTDFTKSTSNAVLQVVSPASTVTTIQSSLNPSAQGQAVTFTANVTSPTTKVTGTVTFTAGGTTLGTDTVNWGGKASITTSALPQGKNTVTATFGGTSNLASSTASLKQIVN
jgi:uncharacterized protein (DUF2141 family)